MKDQSSIIRKNLQERVEILRGCETDQTKRDAAVAMCDRDILFFFKYFCWTYDPRKSPADLPFVPWDYQEKFIVETNKCIESGVSALTEKSRDMGVTWMLLCVFIYRWLFKDDSFLLGSRKEDLVDTIGDMDTHFERCRYVLAKLPDWMVNACGWDRKLSGYMKLYKSTGASLSGESMNKEFSRQGRYKAILLDEFAFVDGAEVIWRSCGDSSPCKLPISTPNGRNNFFAKLRDSGKVKVNTIHWRLHPDKDDAWYEQQKSDRSDKDIAQELDINYTVSAGDPFYRGFTRGLHLRKMSPNKERELILGFDYGFNHPNCIITQITAEGHFLVVDNIFGVETTIDEFGEYCLSYLNQEYRGFLFKQKCYGDPAGKHASDKSRKSSEQVLRDIGFNVVSMPSNTALTNYAARKAIIEKKLRTLIGGTPALIVNDIPSNNIIVEGFEGGYRYPDANKYGGISETPAPDDYFEHPFNCLEYIMVNIFKPVDKTLPKTPINRIRKTAGSNAGFAFSGRG